MNPPLKLLKRPKYSLHSAALYGQVDPGEVISSTHHLVNPISSHTPSPEAIPTNASVSQDVHKLVFRISVQVLMIGVPVDMSPVLRREERG